MNSGEDVSVNYVFQPMVNPLGRIVAVECLSRIMDKKISSDMDSFDFFNTATFEVKKVLHEQIDLIKCNAKWFAYNKVIATINIGQPILIYLLNSGMQLALRPYQFIHYLK